MNKVWIYILLIEFFNVLKHNSVVYKYFSIIFVLFKGGYIGYSEIYFLFLYTIWGLRCRRFKKRNETSTHAHCITGNRTKYYW